MGYIGNAPYQGVLTGGNIQDGTVETTDLANGAVTTVKLGDGQVTAGKLAATLDLTGKTVTLPAGVGGHASGTEANRPAAPAIGTIYFNTDEDTLQQYTSAGWENIGSTPPAISSISGNIYNTIATSLTISGSAFGVGATVRFAYGGSTSDVSVAPTSDTEITVAVPSAVYGQSAGTSVTITVISGGQLSNGSSKTVIGVPTGGTVTTSGGYRIHTFTSSGTFSTGGYSGDVQYLVVAGGGGGGGALRGGGAGAGGYRSSVTGEFSGRLSSAETPVSVTANQSISVVVGLGGSAGPYSDTNGAVAGSNGQASSFGAITSLGGGGGGASDSSGAGRDPGDGGCGGGAWYGQNGAGNQGIGTAGQGFDGGISGASAPYGSGGGGAGEAGYAFDAPTNPCKGGNGIESSITGTPTYYAGGGSSATYPGQSGPINLAGGLGGGGTGINEGGRASGQAPANGTENLGGGGGASGNGGSGIVIVRYQF